MMNKNYFVPVVLSIVAICLGLAVTMSEEQRENLSGLTKDNVEALTKSETEGLDCVFSLNHICTVGHEDHMFYRADR